MQYKTYNIRCGPYTYQVRWEEDGDHDLQDAGAWGYVDSGTRTIRLLRDRDMTRLLDTKLHEYLHVIEHTYNLDIPHWVIHLLATNLAQILHGRVDVAKI